MMCASRMSGTHRIIATKGSSIIFAQRQKHHLPDRANIIHFGRLAHKRPTCRGMRQKTGWNKDQLSLPQPVFIYCPLERLAFTGGVTATPRVFYRRVSGIFFFVIQHAVAKALKVRVGDLIAEFLAHAFCVGSGFAAAGAVTSARFEPFAYGFNYFGVGIELYHGASPVLPEKAGELFGFKVPFVAVDQFSAFDKGKRGDGVHTELIRKFGLLVHVYFA